LQQKESARYNTWEWEECVCVLIYNLEHLSPGDGESITAVCSYVTNG